MWGCLPHWRALATWEEKQGEGRRQKMAKKSSHCGPCFLLHLQQLVCLPGLDPAAAAAHQTKVGTRKVQVGPLRADVALSGDPWSKPRGRKEIQQAQMTAKHMLEVAF